MSTPILSWSKHFYATLDNIVIPKGRRPLDQSKVDAIARSIKDSGLLNPPTVRENPNTKEITVELGRGNVDFKRIFAKAKQAGAQHFFVEQDRSTMSPLESLKISIEFLKKLEF